MGKRSFICRSSLGGSVILCMSILLFSVFGFLWYCVDVLIYGGTVSLPKHFFFQNGLCFRGCKPSEIYISWSFFYKWVVSLFMLIFFTGFCLGISEEDALLVKYLSCTMCIFLRNIGKHDMCSGQKSDIVWCCIFRSYCSFTQHGKWNSTAVLTFLFYISHLTENYTKM